MCTCITHLCLTSVHAHVCYYGDVLVGRKCLPDIHCCNNQRVGLVRVYGIHSMYMSCMLYTLIARYHRTCKYML